MLKKTAVILSAVICTMTMTNCSTKTAPASGIDKTNLDTQVSPKQDFYQYACGGWMVNNPLPDEFSRFGTFDQLAENNREQLKELITGLDRTTAAPGSNAQKIADMYALGMDSVTLNQQGAAPIAADIATINSLNKDSLTIAVATMPGISAFFATGVEPDLANASVNAMYMMQGGLGLGDRDYYLLNTEEEQKVRDAYQTYLTTLATLAGYSEADAQRLVNNTMAIEKQLAQASMSREELRNPAASYNPTSITDFEIQYPNLNLKNYFKSQGIEKIDTIIVGQPAFLSTVNSIIANTDIQALRDYLTAGYLSSAASFLSDDFVNAAFELSKVISGVQEQQPRWKRAMSVPNSILGEALGQLYVEKYFPADSKAKMLDLVGNLQKSLGEHIDSLTWMSDATKAKAHEKLDAFIVKIGYPDQWRDYSELTIDASKPYWENIKQSILFNQNYNLADYGKPVDKTRWHMSPQTVNAYYNPTTNEICFPAGILQKPFFDPEADNAANYGAIGVVIGHEMTHGFDDQGRQFDKNGNLADWWTEEDAAAFTVLADSLASQFDQIIVLGDTHANGRFTLGENIADQGGLRVAHTAYHNSLNGEDGELIDGLTPDQRFYLAYANVWAANIRDAEILRRTKVDPHSLGRWRVNATLRNIEPFFAAFDIEEGDPMYRPAEERVVIW